MIKNSKNVISINELMKTPKDSEFSKSTEVVNKSLGNLQPFLETLNSISYTLKHSTVREISIALEETKSLRDAFKMMEKNQSVLKPLMEIQDSYLSLRQNSGLGFFQSIKDHSDECEDKERNN